MGDPAEYYHRACFGWIVGEVLWEEGWGGEMGVAGAGAAGEGMTNVCSVTPGNGR